MSDDEIKKKIKKLKEMAEAYEDLHNSFGLIFHSAFNSVTKELIDLTFDPSFINQVKLADDTVIKKLKQVGEEINHIQKNVCKHNSVDSTSHYDASWCLICGAYC